MSEQRPEQKPEQAKRQLKGIIDSLAKKGVELTESIFGPLRETNIPPNEFEELKKEAIKKNISPQELAKRCYELAQKYNNSSLPEEFEDWKTNFLNKDSENF